MHASINSYAASKRERMLFGKDSTTSKGAGYMVDLWAVGGPGAPAGTWPAVAGALLSSSTVGAHILPLMDPDKDIQIGEIDWALISQGAHVTLFDRLWHNGGMGLTPANYSVNSPLLTRYTDGEGVELFAVCISAWGSALVAVTVNYINSLGNSSSVQFNPVQSPTVNGIQRVPLAPGDSGIRSITSVMVSGTSSPVGSMGLVLAKRLASFGGIANSFGTKDFISLGTKVEQQACLSFMVLPLTTTTPRIQGELTISEG
jgi:hypothetical protein